MPINVFQTGAQLGSPAKKTASFTPVNDGAMAAAKQSAKTVDITVSAAQKFQEQLEVADVMKANNEYNLRMNELRNKLLENKEDKAFENMRLLEEGRQKILEDIQKNGPQSIRFGTANKAFTNMTDKDWVTQSEAMQRYVTGEAERFTNTQYTNQLNDSIQNAITGYADDQMLADAYARIDTVAMARFYNYGEERIKLEQDKVRAAVTSATITAALGADNYERASEILEMAGTNLTPQERLKFESAIQERKRSDEQLTKFGELYSTYGSDVAAALNKLTAESPTEQMQERQQYMTFFRAKESERTQAENSRFREFSNTVYGWTQQGMSYEDALKEARTQAGADVELMRSNVNAVNAIYKMTGLETGGVGGGYNEAQWIAALQRGAVETEEDAFALLGQMGASNSETSKGVKLFRDWQQSRGVFSYNIESMRTEFFEEAKTWNGMPDNINKNKAIIWNNAVAGAQQKIIEYTQQHKQPPTEAQVRTMLITSAMERPYTIDGESAKYTDGQLARAGIKMAVPTGSGVDIYFSDPTRAAMHVSRETFEDMVIGR